MSTTGCSNENGIGFKKCQKGHVYNAELKECPFCSGMTIDEALKKHSEENPPDDEGIPDNLLAMCYDMGFRDPDEKNWQ